MKSNGCKSKTYVQMELLKQNIIVIYSILGIYKSPILQASFRLTFLNIFIYTLYSFTVSGRFPFILQLCAFDPRNILFVFELPFNKEVRWSTTKEH